MIDMPRGARQCLYIGISDKISLLRRVYMLKGYVISDYNEREMIEISETVDWYEENVIESSKYLRRDMDALLEIYNNIK